MPSCGRATSAPPPRPETEIASHSGCPTRVQHGQAPIARPPALDSSTRALAWAAVARGCGARRCSPPSRRRAHGATWAPWLAIPERLATARRTGRAGHLAQVVRGRARTGRNTVSTSVTVVFASVVSVCSTRAADGGASASQAECHRFEPDRALHYSSDARSRAHGPRASAPTTLLGASPKRSAGRKGG